MRFKPTAFVAALALWASTAHTQTPGTFVSGQTLTAAQLNTALGLKSDYPYLGPINPNILQPISVTAGLLTPTTMAFFLSATMPALPTGTFPAVSWTIAGNGSAAQITQAFSINYVAGYTGPSATNVMALANNSQGTASTLIPAAGANLALGNVGNSAASNGSTTGLNVGDRSAAANGNINVGVLGLAQVPKNGALNIGVVGSGLNTGTTPVQIGGWFSLNQTTPPAVSAALIADNAVQTSPVALFQVAGVTKFWVDPSGLPISPGYLISGLPACGAGQQGARAHVTNGQTTPTFLGTVSATGSTVAPVFCNGSAWVYG